MVSKLSDEVLQSFEMRFWFRSYFSSHEYYSSIKFSGNGKTLIASRNDNAIETFDCNTSQRKLIPSKKYGCGLIDYCNNDENILVTSTIREKAVRELCIEKNMYNTCFLGHTDSITALAVHPNKNTFLTGSLDKRILLYDIRIATAQAAQTHLPDTPLISWDPNGMMFAVGFDENSIGSEANNCDSTRNSTSSKENTIRLYDIRGLGNGPLLKFNFNAESSMWKSLKFSPNGEKILISTNGAKVRVIDSFFGKVLRVYGGRKNMLNLPIDAAFTPDSDYILSGSSDGKLIIYSNNQIKSEDNKIIAELSSISEDPIIEAEYNPKYAMIATGGTYFGIWLPKCE